MGFLRGTAAAVVIIFAFNRGEHFRPDLKVGDVYAEFEDDRQDDYALTNGFPAMNISIFQVLVITNGIAYCSIHNVELPTNDLGNANANIWKEPNGGGMECGPIQNFKKFPECRTYIHPDPK
jgi:hypothetical protein